ncbi:MAG: hypothetical protein ABIK28_10900, partial [Planctomycetota bacterium]
YQEMMGHASFDPIAFRAYLTGQDSAAREPVEALQNILKMIDDLDLPARERQHAAHLLLVPVTPASLTVAQLQAAIAPVAY